MDKSYKKLLLTKADLNRITTKTIKEKVRKSKKYPDGLQEIQVFLIDGRQIKGGIKQAEDELRLKIWKERQKAEFRKNHGGFFKQN